MTPKQKAHRMNNEADPSLSLVPNTFFRTQVRGTYNQEYQIYLDCADDGKGGDITRNGAPLKTYEEWLGI